jgi:tetratricopeptide (TPR) repeat protein
METIERLYERHDFEALIDVCLNKTGQHEILFHALSCASEGKLPQANKIIQSLDKNYIKQNYLKYFVELLILMGENKSAHEIIHQELIIDPLSAPWLLLAGECNFNLGNTKIAEIHFNQCCRLNPASFKPWLKSAALHYVQHNHESALSEIEQAAACLAEEPDLKDAHLLWLDVLQLALKIHFSINENIDFLAWYQTVFEKYKQGDFSRLAHCYALILTSKSRHEDAVVVLSEALKKAPTDIPITLMLFELHSLFGRYGQALRLLNHAIKSKPNNLELNLALATFHQSRANPVAGKFIQKALGLIESFSNDKKEIFLKKIICLECLVDSDNKKYPEAIERLESLLEKDTTYSPALRILGNLYLQMGDVDRSINCFEKLKDIDPVSGHVSLINAKIFPTDKQLLQALEMAAYQPSFEGAVRTGIIFQLAAAWEKNKNYGKAFELIKIANENSKAMISYAPKLQRNKCARIRKRFDAAFIKSRKFYGNPSVLPVFIVGMPRSGTTLVEQILSGHSQIFGAGELDVIPQTIAGLHRWERHTGSGRNYPDCVDDLSPQVVQGVARGILKELQQHDPSAAFIVDKLPHNFENIGLIKLLFPNAKIISVRRDPRDIAISNYFTDYQAKHGGMGFSYDLTWIGEQLADHNLLLHHWNQLFPGEILNINYEDVIEDTEGMARKMLNYIGVDWEPQVLNSHELDRPVKTASVWQVRQPIYKTSKAKWEKYKDHLAPLIQGTNAKIEPDPIHDMVSLPEPGLLNEGVAFYKANQLDEAEYSFKKLMHHIPLHAAANYMVGVIYVRKGHVSEGIALIQKALDLAPWKRDWAKDLANAYELTQQTDKAEALKAMYKLSQLPDGQLEAAKKFDVMLVDSDVDGFAMFDQEAGL